MKRVTVFETSDGVLHRERRKAAHHAEERYGNHLLAVSKNITGKFSKYKETIEFLDENLDEFLDQLNQLKALRDDRDLMDSEDDEAFE